jgi:hypothetical protein
MAVASAVLEEFLAELSLEKEALLLLTKEYSLLLSFQPPFLMEEERQRFLFAKQKVDERIALLETCETVTLQVKSFGLSTELMLSNDALNRLAEVKKLFDDVLTKFIPPYSVVVGISEEAPTE